MARGKALGNTRIRATTIDESEGMNGFAIWEVEGDVDEEVCRGVGITKEGRRENICRCR